jgi:hypothetical protein
LFGVFDRPPSSDKIYYSLIEDLLGLAIDTGISDVILTGDFNLNIDSQTSSRKIQALCQQYGLTQIIDEHTHFTENSSSLIDMFTNNNVIKAGVGDPFLQQHVRYHCPIFAVFTYIKPKAKYFDRTVWLYEKGNYDLLRSKMNLVKT